MAKRPKRRPPPRGRRARSAARASAPRRVITIRARDGRTLREAHITEQAPLSDLAREWGYILRARPRWTPDDGLRQDFRDRALHALERLGVGRAFVRRLAALPHVEVELHSWDPADADASRIHEAASEVPWEYLISAGTRGEGRVRPLLVTRLLRNDEPPMAIGPPPSRRVLFVESGPGLLECEFENERARIRSAVGADRSDPGADPAMAQMVVVSTPSVSELRKAVRGNEWDVVHVTGVDTHQAASWIVDLYEWVEEEHPRVWRKISDSTGRVLDGMILREGVVAELPVNYAELAELLVNPKHPPSLVTLNLYHSGARVARELVRRGARATLGFLDEIDDELAERFFQAFYWEWCRGGATAITQAFVKAWGRMADPRLRGTAVVIWLGYPVFEEFWTRVTWSQPPPPPPETLADRQARLAALPVRDLLQVELEVDEEVNYSLLHNDRPVLSKLTLTKLVEEPLEDIAVQVELNVGAQTYPYRCTHLLLDEPQLSLAPQVKIPLTAALPRALQERVHSTVYVKVTCSGRAAFEATRRVTLIPVDEWLDDTDHNPWLPSFVLPRDPAVLGIIQASRRYLIGIQDDPTAGFDGYQSWDREADDPGAGVHAQVKAIWSAIVNELRLQYINPPPAYSKQTQRLRTPSEIVGSKTGTCIDLALLLASCFEYIDIYPVVVLLSGHAFAGYWRSEGAHDDLVAVKRIPPEVAAVGSRAARRAAVAYVDPFGWRLTRLQYDEILASVAAGDMVLLEATYLTTNSSFADAVTEGRANMRSRREFDSLLDIRLARTAQPPVTPLPILEP